MSTKTVKTVSFQATAAALTQKGDFRDVNEGNHPLTCVSSTAIQKALQEANARGASVFWGVLCVLLRLRYGNFVFEKRKGSPLIETKIEARDDFAFSYQGIFSHMLSKYGDNLIHLGQLFNGARSVKPDVFKFITETKGFELQVGISILVFLRDNAKNLPKFENTLPDREEVLEILFPILWAAFVSEKQDFTRDGFFHFYRGSKGSQGISPVLGDGKAGIPVGIDTSSAYDPEVGDLILTNEDINFVTIVKSGTSNEVLKMAGNKDYESLYYALFERPCPIIDDENDGSEEMADQVVYSPIEYSPIVQDEDDQDTPIATNPKLKELRQMIDSLRSEISVLDDQRLRNERLISSIDDEIEAERNRHRDAMEKLNGQRQDAKSSLDGVKTQLEELEAGLKNLGFNSK
jgi:hypothetical protein